MFQSGIWLLIQSFRKYVRAGFPIWFVESENVGNIGSSLDLGLNVAEEGS